MPAFDTTNGEREACRTYLRPYRDEDFGAIYALDVVCFQAQFRFSEATMRKVVGARNASVHVACEVESGNIERLVGFCAANLEGRGRSRVGYLATLDVAPAHRGRGIGRALLGMAEREVMGKGAREMRLHVFAGNTAAVRLYEAKGYRTMRRVAEFYGIGMDALEYGRVLTPCAPGSSAEGGLTAS